MSDAAVCSQRKTLDDALFVTPFEKDGDYFLFNKTAETLVLSKKPLTTMDISSDKFESDSMPDLYPLKSNVSIGTENIYEKRNIYRKFNTYSAIVVLHLNKRFVFFLYFDNVAVAKGANFEHPHTAFIHYNPMNVFNYTLEPVRDDQVESRALLKAFTFAAAKAQSLYGVSIAHRKRPSIAN